MQVNKKKILKAVLWLLLFAVIALVLWYLFSTYSRFNDNDVALDEIIGNEYYNEDITTYVVFKDDTTAIISANGAQTPYTYVYSDNIFTFTDSAGTVTHFILTTDGAIFGTGHYFYNTENNIQNDV